MKQLTINKIIAVIVIVGFIIFGIYYFMSLTTTMDKAVLNKLDKTNITFQISRIPVKTDSVASEDVKIADQDQISDVFEQIPNLKLKKTKSFDEQDIIIEYDVLIYSKDNQNLLFVVSFLNDKSVSIYDKRNKETSQKYSITSDFDYKSFIAKLEQLLNLQ